MREKPRFGKLVISILIILQIAALSCATVVPAQNATLKTKPSQASRAGAAIPAKPQSAPTITPAARRPGPVFYGLFPINGVGFDQDDGALEGFVHEKLELRLVGRHIHDGMLVTFASNEDECTSAQSSSLVGNATVNGTSTDNTTATLVFTMNTTGDFCLCYQSQTGWAPIKNHWTGDTVWLEIRDPHQAQAEVPKWAVALMALGLLCLSGLFSGLNLGLLALDPNDLLKIMNDPSDPVNARFAARVYPLRKRGNMLLCTILIGNVSVNSTLSVVLEEFTNAGGVWVVILSTCCITMFGEIIPQSFCMKHALAVGGRTYWICWVFVVLLSPITYPISLLLDSFIGDIEGAGKENLHPQLSARPDNEADDAIELKPAGDFGSRSCSPWPKWLGGGPGKYEIVLDSEPKLSESVFDVSHDTSGSDSD